MKHHHIARRLGVLTAGAALSLGAFAPAQAASSPSADSATGWLNGQLPTANYFVYDGTTYADTGLTIDTGFAALADRNTALATRVLAGVSATIGAYTTYTDSGETTTYGSSTGKALAFVTQAGANPRSVGDRDLLAQMESLVLPDGRITDNGPYAGDPNVLGQAFAVQGLVSAGSPKAPAALSYLLALQCGSGAFGFDLPAQGAAATCTDASANPGADVTSLVGSALGHLKPTTATDSAIARAATFLAATGQNGGYGGASGSSTAAANSNSTGLAAALLGASCRTQAADRAADQVRTLQVPSGATGVLSGQGGAVAYDQAAFTAAQTDGITDDTRDQFRRTTAQAETGLVWDDQAPANLTLTGPAKAAPRSTQTITITGAASGETVCLTTPAGVQRLVGTGQPLTVGVTTPVNGKATYTATAGPGLATYTLASKVQAEVKTKKVSVGDKVKVKLTGIKPGAKVVTTIRGTKVDKTKAGADGTATVKFTLTKKVAKPGKATLKIKAAGQPAVKKTIRIVKP